MNQILKSVLSMKKEELFEAFLAENVRLQSGSMSKSAFYKLADIVSTMNIVLVEKGWADEYCEWVKDGKKELEILKEAYGSE